MFVLIKLFFILMAIISAIGAFIAHRVRKNRMTRALGRDVQESDLTSLNSWMQVVEKEDNAERQQRQRTAAGH